MMEACAATSQRASIRILTVDDHPMLREGLASVINADPSLELVGECSNGEEAIRLFRMLQPDVTLMDLQMPVMTGLEAVAAIREDFPDARIIVLTTYSGDAQAAAALKAGAAGYLLKNSLRHDLVHAISAVHKGLRFLHPEVASEIAFHAGHEELRERELQTLELVARGKANKEIATQLHLSEETVKSHMRTIFSKLNVTDRTQAVVVALRRGIIGIE